MDNPDALITFVRSAFVNELEIVSKRRPPVFRLLGDWRERSYPILLA